LNLPLPNVWQHKLTLPEKMRDYKKVNELNSMNQSSIANVIAGIASFIIPGLGQLVQGRIKPAAFLAISAALLWIIALGWIVGIYAAYEAATYNG
jgi:TM2 domain-containing membrane protein YozV